MKKIKSTVFLLLIFQLSVNLNLNAQTKSASEQKNWKVRIANIEVDTMYLEKYKIAVKEHTAAALQKEPGVLMLYAVFEKARPGKVTVFEVYKDEAAYQLHIKTAHFLKYKSGTKHMVKSLVLTDVQPIALGIKPEFVKQLKQ